LTDIVDERVRGDRAQGVQVLARAAEILRLLKVNRSGLTQAEIASKLGLARTTVHRLLNALADENLVQPIAASSRYRLGSEILHMAESARSAVLAEVHPRLIKLSQEIDETVDLSVLDRGQVTFIDQVVAPQRLRAVSMVGASFPLHCTANGKAILAALPIKDRKRLLEGRLEQLTPNTITSQDKLLRELVKVGPKGVAYDREEHSLGICAVGMAIIDTPLGPSAISVPIPAQRFDAKSASVLKALARAVRDVQAMMAI
jgi:DNA-binding IclR family transcriptional regulator